MEKKENAYLTVYLSLSLGVLMALCLVMIEGVRRNGAALEASCAADVGMQSIMAEYHRELLNQYNLFAIDSSYGTSSCGRKNTEAHLGMYLEKNLQVSGRDFFSLDAAGAELTGVSILTDEDGAVFRRRAVEAVKDDVGLELLEQVEQWAETVEINGLEKAETEEEKAELDREIEEYQTEGGQITNPTDRLEEMRGSGILRLVLEDESALSDRTAALETLAGSRMKQGDINKGNISTTAEESDLTEKFFFQEYLLRYMGHYGAEKEGSLLAYQLEYLVAGKSADEENLRSVANRLCAMREAANASYLFSDEVKMEEAEALAAVICTIFLVPELTPALQTTILLGWAYAESVYDVKVLLAGEKVPLLKDAESWHFDLEGALSGNLGEVQESEDGLSYEDYLRLFLFLTDTDTLTARAMDMVEADIRQTPGNAAFRLDACYDRVQAKINVSSGWGYDFELVRTASY